MPPEDARVEIRRYLLGGLDEAQAAGLEERYFADPALFDEIWASEIELIDEYLAGGLPAEERRSFETDYLASPVHRDRVATARALRDRIRANGAAAVVDIREARRRRPAGGRVGAGWLVVAAAAALAAISWLWFVVGPVSPPPPQQVQVPGESPGPPPAPPVPPQPGPPHPGPIPPGPPDVPAPDGPAPAAPTRSLLAVTLSPIVTRGESQRSERLPEPPADLLLQLEGAAEPGDRAYTVEIQTVDGRVVWQGRARPAEAGTGRLTSVRVPAQRLEPDDYVVAVFATTDGRTGERGRYALRLTAR